jgi:hypothetical protein
MYRPSCKLHLECDHNFRRSSAKRYNTPSRWSLNRPRYARCIRTHLFVHMRRCLVFSSILTTLRINIIFGALLVLTDARRLTRAKPHSEGYRSYPRVNDIEQSIEGSPDRITEKPAILDRPPNGTGQDSAAETCTFNNAPDTS